MSEEDTKAIMKEALKEWLDNKIYHFGRWSLYTMACSGLFALIYFILSMNGFHK